ncbi:hypothetical protein [Sorangium sp. So ce1182]|uniref:hypothetical protein n=1 Tax=Sorangium sp. So ce1182 TaxID=3133334 RepID=UPI003F61C2E7
MNQHFHATASIASILVCFASGCIFDHKTESNPDIEEVEPTAVSASQLCTDNGIADATFALPPQSSCNGIPSNIDCDAGEVFLGSPSATYADDHRCTARTANGAFVVDIGSTYGHKIGVSVQIRPDLEQSICESAAINITAYGLGNYGWTKIKDFRSDAQWMYIDSWFCSPETWFLVDASEYYMIRVAAEASWISGTTTIELPTVVAFPHRGVPSRRKITVPVYSPLPVDLSIWESLPFNGTGIDLSE